MLARFRAAGLIWPTLWALAALVVLLGLGTWQMQRKAWKDGLVAAIGERTTAAPVALAALREQGQASSGLGPEYRRVRLAGRYLHGQERHLYMPAKQGQGWHVITPLVVDGGGIVLVNRGWIPDASKDQARRREGQIEGRHELTGLVRMPERPGWFTPANDADRNIWFWRDLHGMLACRPTADAGSDECRALAHAHAPPQAGGQPARYPYFVDAEALPANPGGWPKGGTTNFDIPNRHLEYAITWYGLALTLIGVFAAFAWGRLTATRGQPITSRAVPR